MFIVSTQVLEKKLAACVSFRNIHSRFWWNGKLESVNEVQLLFKTTEEKLYSLLEGIKKMHSYDVPELIYWNINADLNYQKWLANVLEV